MAWFDTLSLGLRRKLPLMLQTEAAECGLACVGMVMGYHGALTDLSTLRRRHAMSMKGITLAKLIQVIQAEKLGTRAVRLELDELVRLRTPAILHWELNHFVVLKEASSKGITVHDPAFGVRRLTLTEASQYFTGVAVEIWPDPGFVARKETTPITLGQLAGHIVGLWPALLQIMLLTLAIEVFALASPLFMQWVLDHVLVAADAPLLTTLAIGFGLLLFLQIGVSTVRQWALLTLGTVLRVQWRSNVFSHLTRLPLEYFHKRHLGDVVSRSGSIDEIQKVLTTAFVASMFDGLLAVLTLAMMLIYSPMLAALAVIAVLLYLALRLAWYRPLYRATEEQIVRSANLSSHYLETIRGIRAIKLFGRHAERRGAWQTLLVQETNASLTTQKLRIAYGTAQALLGGLSYVVLMWLGASLIMTNQLSIGMLMAFLAYRAQFDTRISALIDQALELRMLRLYAERLGDIVGTPAEASGDTVRPDTPGESRGSVQIENLRFRYSDDDPWVLNGLNLSIPEGQSIAITGPSGCGKTTLVNLLLGVLKPVEGSLSRNGATVEQLGADRWRRSVGTVMQDDSLFAGSIADNISFFDAAPDLQRIEECARLASVHDDVNSMPMGYQTLVGDMGTVLSGGQKQRILLARALYKRPSVLILDEATSHLDLRREAEINHALSQMQITRIAVAHRPETIGAAQRVVELSGGVVSFDGDARTYLERTRDQRWADWGSS
jgi:ATP-binding cassette, subfamily B, bacterial CvaB/MchF/RaxB